MLPENAKIYREQPYINIDNKEQPIIIQGIIDIIAMNENKITVIDYKTSAVPRPEHHIQVQQYLNAVSQAFPGKQAAAYIYYIMSDNLEML